MESEVTVFEELEAFWDCLRMKQSPSMRASSGASEKKIGLSQSEVEVLIKKEIRRAMISNEAKLQGLIKSVQQLNNEVDYESAISKLQGRINLVTQKAEVALAYMKKMRKKTPLPSLVNVRADSDDESVETMLQNKESMDCMERGGRLFQMLETTKKALKRMHADNKALTAAIAGLSQESPPTSVLTPYGSPNCKGPVRFMKKESKDKQEKENTTDKLKQFEEPEAKRVKVECISPGKSRSPKHPESPQQEKIMYPPLPATTFPSTLRIEAASYNIPQRPVVHLALIKEPPGLSVLWKVEEDDPCAPPMDSYSVYMTTEKFKGSCVFPDWKIIGEVRAIPLPMCVMITKYKPGHKLCVAVVGKDMFGRYGPYSKVVTAAIPD